MPRIQQIVVNNGSSLLGRLRKICVFIILIHSAQAKDGHALSKDLTTGLLMIFKCSDLSTFKSTFWVKISFSITCPG